MKHLLILGALATLTAPAFAACRDAKGKFIECSKAAASPAATGITKDAKGRCHMKGGKFVKCPAK